MYGKIEKNQASVASMQNYIVCTVLDMEHNL